jgi:hypothetical protein
MDYLSKANNLSLNYKINLLRKTNKKKFIKRYENVEIKYKLRKNIM